MCTIVCFIKSNILIHPLSVTAYPVEGLRGLELQVAWITGLSQKLPNPATAALEKQVKKDDYKGNPGTL